MHCIEKLSTRVKFLIGILAAACGLLWLSLGVAAAAPVPTASAGVPTGLGYNMHNLGSTRDWRLIAASGAKFVRADFVWSAIERTKGHYNFGPYDKSLKGMQAAGLRPIWILDYGNPLYPPPETSKKGRAAYARWAAASAAHFKGRHVIWEIWNEPNVGFWHGKGGLNSPEFADEYVALVKKTVAAMRAANPHCYILGGAVSCLWSGSFRWLNQALKIGLLRTGINALSVHPYGFTRPETEINARQPGAVADQGYSTLRQMMAQYHSPNFPVVATEVGYPTGRGVTPQDQAALSVRQVLVDEMCHVPLTVLYNWDPRQARGFVIRSHPVYNALKVLTGQLAGFQYSRRLHVGSKLDYVVEFTGPAGSSRIIAWTVPKNRDASQSQAVPNTVAVPILPAAIVHVENLYGKSLAAKTAGGKVTLHLTAMPVYVDLTSGLGTHVMDGHKPGG